MGLPLEYSCVSSTYGGLSTHGGLGTHGGLSMMDFPISLKKAFCWFNKSQASMQVGTIIRSLNIYPTEKQLQRWIHEIEEEEPTGFIVYEKFEALVLDTRMLDSYPC